VGDISNIFRNSEFQKNRLSCESCKNQIFDFHTDLTQCLYNSLLLPHNTASNKKTEK